MLTIIPHITHTTLQNGHILAIITKHHQVCVIRDCEPEANEPALIVEVPGFNEADTMRKGNNTVCDSNGNTIGMFVYRRDAYTYRIRIRFNGKEIGSVVIPTW